jgi:hypothetical protein
MRQVVRCIATGIHGAHGGVNELHPERFSLDGITPGTLFSPVFTGQAIDPAFRLDQFLLFHGSQSPVRPVLKGMFLV